MTRNLNIPKMKADAAKAVRVAMSERGLSVYDVTLYGIEPEALQNIYHNKIREYSLDQIHSILGRIIQL